MDRTTAAPTAKALTGLYPGYGLSPVERLRRHTLILFWTVVLTAFIDHHLNGGRWLHGGLMGAVVLMPPLLGLAG